jgi:hypothetical protein
MKIFRLKNQTGITYFLSNNWSSGVRFDWFICNRPFMFDTHYYCCFSNIYPTDKTNFLLPGIKE